MNRIEQLRQFLKEDPGDAFVKYALSLEYAQEGKVEEAGKILLELTIKNPPYLPAFYQYGKLLEASGDLESASTIYSKGMEIAKSERKQKTYSELKEARDQVLGTDEE